MDETLTHYQRAVALGPDYVIALGNSTLTSNRATHLLFDTGRYTRHLESAYETMWQRYQRGEPPASFAVPALAPGLAVP